MKMPIPTTRDQVNMGVANGLFGYILAVHTNVEAAYRYGMKQAEKRKNLTMAG
jgi:hypothetical protein